MVVVRVRGLVQENGRRFDLRKAGHLEIVRVEIVRVRAAVDSADLGLESSAHSVRVRMDHRVGVGHFSRVRMDPDRMGRGRMGRGKTGRDRISRGWSGGRGRVREHRSSRDRIAGGSEARADLRAERSRLVRE